MCEKCVEMDETISRYRRLQYRVNDQQMQEAADRLVAELEAKKAALHPEEQGGLSHSLASRNDSSHRDLVFSTMELPNEPGLWIYHFADAHGRRRLGERQP